MSATAALTPRDSGTVETAQAYSAKKEFESYYGKGSYKIYKQQCKELNSCKTTYCIKGKLKSVSYSNGKVEFYGTLKKYVNGKWKYSAKKTWKFKVASVVLNEHSDLSAFGKSSAKSFCNGLKKGYYTQFKMKNGKIRFSFMD